MKLLRTVLWLLALALVLIIGGTVTWLTWSDPPGPSALPWAHKEPPPPPKEPETKGPWY